MRYGVPRALVKPECRWATVIFARADDPGWRQPGDDRARSRAAPAGAARGARPAARGDRRRRAGHRQDPPGPRAAGHARRPTRWCWSGRPSRARSPGRTRCCWTPSTAAPTSTRSSSAALADRGPQPGRAPAHRAGDRRPSWSATRPAVLVFEDLHWADSESAALFERHRRPARAAAADRHLPAGRGHQPPPDRRRCWPGWSGGTRSPTCALERLDRGRDRGAAGRGRPARPAPYRAAAALHQRTGGNPFFLEELLRGHDGDDLDDAVSSSRCRGAWPRCCAARSTTSTRPSQRIVEAAAVLGHRIPFDLLAAVTGAGEDELIAALRDAGRPAACWSRPARTSSASGTRWCARRSPTSCSAGSGAGCTRRRWTRCSRAGGADPAMVAHHAQRRRPLRRHGRRRPARRRALPVHRLGLPGAAAGRDGAGRGRRRPRAARRRRPGGLAGRAARRRRRLRPALARPAPSTPPSGPTRSTC